MAFAVAAACAAACTAVCAMPARAQDSTTAAACLKPDSILVRGNVRTTAERAVALSGLAPGRALSSFLDIRQAVQGLMGSGEYDYVETSCEVKAGSAAIVLKVVERPVLASIDVVGPKAIAQHTVEDRVEVLLGRAVDPALVTKAVTRIDSLYTAQGYTLIRVVPETTIVAPGRIGLTIKVFEGPRVAIAGVQVLGTKKLLPADIVHAMKTQPEGFWWWRTGEYDDEKFAGDLGERIPALFTERGFLDGRIVRDTLVVDRTRGKALIQITVDEGEQYRIGSFGVSGNQHFSDAQLKRYYPFNDDGLSAAQHALNVLRGKHIDPTIFDHARWDSATKNVLDAYRNEGYVYADVEPVVERSRGADSTPVANMRWDITERNPAIINRVDIVGNDYTTERCIRDMITLVPGSVFNQAQLLRSYQQIANLGLFETPLPFPETPRANENGDLNVVFHVKEKRTGTFNFGASMGQGVGVGGFIGLEHPNLFGQCKRASLNWQFGRYLNDFNLSYTDPAVNDSRVSGTVSAYRSQARYQIADLGQSTRTGGSIRIGVPVPHTTYTRAFLSYTGEAVRYGNSGLLGTVSNDCSNCFRSAIGIDLTRDNRLGLPFPISGSLQSISTSFNGGPLGGSATFQRYTGEYRTYAALTQFGGGALKSEPMVLVLGISARSGAVFGNTGPFFPSQRFALGGVQYGEPLRGYPEFSITPAGFLTGTSTYNASRASFGSAFFASTVELGLRFNSQFYLDAFYDAGNVWATPRQFDPTRLYRGAGVGISTLTPLGPLGLDLGYGFDRLDAAGRRDPKWQLHFRLGQIF